MLAGPLDLAFGALLNVDEGDVNGVAPVGGDDGRGSEDRQDLLELGIGQPSAARGEPVRADPADRDRQVGQFGAVYHDRGRRRRAEVAAGRTVGKGHRVPHPQTPDTGLLVEVLREVVPVPRRLVERAAVHRHALTARIGVPVAAFDLVPAALRLEHDQSVPRMNQHEIRLTVARRPLAVGRGNEPQPVHNHPVVTKLL